MHHATWLAAPRLVLMILCLYLQPIVRPQSTFRNDADGGPSGGLTYYRRKVTNDLFCSAADTAAMSTTCAAEGSRLEHHFCL